MAINQTDDCTPGYSQQITYCGNRLTKPSDRVSFNISGEIFETTNQTLKRFPNTLLSSLSQQSSYYCHHSDVYFFNRNRQCFGPILFFYQSHGILSCPSEVSVKMFAEECRFYELGEDIVSQMEAKEGLLPPFKIEEKEGNPTLLGRYWDILEHPETSNSAKTFALVSFGVIMLSIITACLETVPSLQVASDVLSENYWSIFELVINTWFLLEFLARFITSPSKLVFLKALMNWIDAVAIFPYFFTLNQGKGKIGSLCFLRILRLFRVLRLFRLSKHSRRINVISQVAKECTGDLQVLCTCYMIMLVLGGSVLYFVEDAFSSEERVSQFTSIPNSIWWAIVTVSTVGYGDIVPLSIMGRLLTAVFMIFGAVTMCLPILSIATKFIDMYVKNVEGDRLIM